MNTHVLFWLCTANTACLTLDIDDAICAQINYCRSRTVFTYADCSSTLGLFTNGNLTIVINNSIATIHQNTYLVGSIADQLSGCVFVVLCCAADKDLAVFFTIKCTALLYTYAGNTAVWRTIYGYIDNTAGFIGCRGIII
ncbi:hypothetical protein [Neisseria sp. HMSC31F04]|uniref:hypothetical protein n=1 Tax=Neisseria sp. HMSC31F04 TaxID=1581075 RepID=UPI001FEEF530|nr:hypothetical protein [Neisseria sp. HMSC31F04]